jgi:TM2 domain-containing membrane protein YozV
MEENKVDMFIMANGKFFASENIPQLRSRLLDLDNSKWGMIQSIDLKNPTTVLIVSLLVGYLGIDRFMIGDTGLGIGKLLTCGGFGIWAIVDWFLIMDATKSKNMNSVNQYMY